MWDAYRKRQAGWIPGAMSADVTKRIEAGRLTHALCLWEWLLNNQRIGLQILVAAGPPVPEIVY